MDVLLVDDDPSADAIADHLEDQAGWAVRRATSLEEALEAAGEADLDAAVAAWGLPDGSGLDVVEALRREAPGVPVVVLADAVDKAWEAIGRGAAAVVERGDDLGPTLEAELRRVVDELEGVGSLAVVDVEAASREPGVGDAGPETPQDLVESLVDGSVRGALLLGPSGPPEAAFLPDDVDAIDVAARARTVAKGVDALSRAAGSRSRGFLLIVEAPQGPLGVAAVPGPQVVVLLLEPDVTGGDAMAVLMEASLLAWDVLGP